jgi:hypothetical protein
MNQVNSICFRFEVLGYLIRSYIKRNKQAASLTLMPELEIRVIQRRVVGRIKRLLGVLRRTLDILLLDANNNPCGWQDAL